MTTRFLKCFSLKCGVNTIVACDLISAIQALFLGYYYSFETFIETQSEHNRHHS